MKIEYRPADCKKELKPIIEDFFRFYKLKGVSKIRVEPSIDTLTPGIIVCPAEGSVIEEICVKNSNLAGKTIRSGSNYTNISLKKNAYLIYLDYQEPWTKE